MSYPCSSCGCCCKRMGLIVGAGAYFPYEIKADGSCSKLTEDNKCSVYDERPLICNIDKVAETFEIDKEIFYKANAAICNEMMDEDNIPESFRVKI